MGKIQPKTGEGREQPRINWKARPRSLRVCVLTLIAAFQVIPDVMDEEWLGQANAAVDIALSSDGFNEFNSGG